MRSPNCGRPAPSWGPAPRQPWSLDNVVRLHNELRAEGEARAPGVRGGGDLWQLRRGDHAQPECAGPGRRRAHRHRGEPRRTGEGRAHRSAAGDERDHVVGRLGVSGHPVLAAHARDNRRRDGRHARGLRHLPRDQAADGPAGRRRARRSRRARRDRGARPGSSRARRRTACRRSRARRRPAGRAVGADAGDDHGGHRSQAVRSRREGSRRNGAGPLQPVDGRRAQRQPAAGDAAGPHVATVARQPGTCDQRRHGDVGCRSHQRGLRAAGKPAALRDSCHAHARTRGRFVAAHRLGVRPVGAVASWRRPRRDRSSGSIRLRSTQSQRRLRANTSDDSSASTRQAHPTWRGTSIRRSPGSARAPTSAWPSKS